MSLGDVSSTIIVSFFFYRPRTNFSSRRNEFNFSEYSNSSTVVSSNVDRSTYHSTRRIIYHCPKKQLPEKCLDYRDRGISRRMTPDPAEFVLSVLPRKDLLQVVELYHIQSKRGTTIRVVNPSIARHERLRLYECTRVQDTRECCIEVVYHRRVRIESI